MITPANQTYKPLDAALYWTIYLGSRVGAVDAGREPPRASSRPRRTSSWREAGGSSLVHSIVTRDGHRYLVTRDQHGIVQVSEVGKQVRP